MTLFGKSLSNYLEFQKILLILTVTFGLCRLILSMVEVRAAIVTWFSMTALLLVAMVYYPIQAHMKNFGSYRQVFILLTIQVLCAQVITSAGILTALLTGMDNIFSVAGPSTNHGYHVAVHLLSWPVVSIFLWLPASLVLLITRHFAKASAIADG